MKELIFVNGTMGVGKTAVCRALHRRLGRSAFLDGDWCWEMNPFVVDAETREMVLDNIAYLLSNFLRCSHFDTVLFCWVMQEQAIMDEVLSRLTETGYRLRCFTLMAPPEVVAARLQSDIQAGKREESVIARSLARLPLYGEMDTQKIETAGLTPEQAAEEILRALERPAG